MDIARFESSIRDAEPPADLPQLLEALWFDAHGDWARAHAITQGEAGEQAAAVHAYLHRKEGDLANADYWYARAHRQRPAGALGDEWRALAIELLSVAGRRRA